MYIIILIIVLIIIGLGLNTLYKRTNAYNNQFIDINKFRKLSKLPDHSLDLVTLGSNAPKFAFDFSEIKDLKCANWCVGPETFEYDAVLLKKFHRKLKLGATVVWTVCPGNFFLYKFLNKNNIVKYYRILSSEEFPEYNKAQKIRDYDYPLLFYPKQIKRLIRDIKKDNRLQLNHNLLDKNEIQKDAEWWIRKCWNPEFGIDIEYMQPLSDMNQKSIMENIKIVRQVAEYCKEHRLKLTLVYLPLTKELSDLFPDSYVNEFMKDCSKEAIKGFDVSIVDYMRDTRFQNYEYYINSFFMNRKGAKLFTNIFVKENILCE